MSKCASFSYILIFMPIIILSIFAIILLKMYMLYNAGKNNMTLQSWQNLGRFLEPGK